MSALARSRCGRELARHSRTNRLSSRRYRSANGNLDRGCRDASNRGCRLAVLGRCRLGPLFGQTTTRVWQRRGSRPFQVARVLPVAAPLILASRVTPPPRKNAILVQPGTGVTASVAIHPNGGTVSMTSIASAINVSASLNGGLGTVSIDPGDVTGRNLWRVLHGDRRVVSKTAAGQA